MNCPVVLQVFFTGHASVPHSLPREYEVAEGHTPKTHYLGMPVWLAYEREAGNGEAGPRRWRVNLGAGATPRPVYRWSIDMIVASDERWMVFGEFATRAQALHALALVPGEQIDGYRLINEHCFEWTVVGRTGALMPAEERKRWPRQMWTDG